MTHKTLLLMWKSEYFCEHRAFAYHFDIRLDCRTKEMNDFKELVPVRTSAETVMRLGFARGYRRGSGMARLLPITPSNDQRAIQISRWFSPNMLDLALPIRAQIVIA